MIRTEITEVARPSSPMQRFDKTRAEEEMRGIVEQKLRGKTYDSEECSKLSKELADEIRAKVRLLADGRFKICVSVMIIGQRGQGVRVDNRCHYDPNADTELTYVYRCEEFVCIATLYAIYFY
ncbi:Dynein light chain [Giardia muris]|uniref:Dynein light chain n=1 Tax=Giardia muris TaxID=5742 RepID=A0A4Z1SXY1_GIAMU|nr:Dynein light chain [Giardia muris]|eukprot:TNJ30564.1 Dynein light chain [Giardia muris]